MKCAHTMGESPLKIGPKQNKKVAVQLSVLKTQSRDDGVAVHAAERGSQA
jgi:hypothetical protein